MLKQLFFLFLIAFATCEIAKQEVQVIEDVIEENEYNWDALIACLREVTPVSRSVKRLIFLVRKKRFEEAEAALQKMIEKGSQLIKDCLPKNEIMLEVNWGRVLNCLLSIGTSIPGILKIIFFLKTFNIPMVIIEAINLGSRAKEIFNSCKRQG